MATPIAVNDILKVRLNYYQSGADVQGFNILHYKVSAMTGTTPAMAAALSAIGSYIFSYFSVLWDDWAGPDSAMIGVTVQDVFPLPRSVATTFVPGAPHPGLGTEDSLPTQDAPTLLKTTDFGQRWGIGRLFYFGLAEDFQDNGQVIGGAVAGLNLMAGALADQLTITSGGWTVTLSPVLISGSEDNPTRVTPITGGRLSNSVIKSQKRRRPGKGI